MNIKIKGNQKQKTSTQGKNYFTGNKINSGTEKGVAYSFNNSTLHLNGTTTANGNIVLDKTTKIKIPAGTYTYTIKQNSGTFERPTGSDFAIYLMSGSNTFITGDYASSGISGSNLTNNSGLYSKTFTITEETEIFIRIFTSSSSVVFNNLELEIQIESGSTYTGMEQFIPNSPSPDYPSKVETVGSNVNLFDKDNMDVIEGAFINSSTKKIEANANRKCFYLEISPNKTYTISREKIASNFIVGTTNGVPTVGSDIIDIDFNNNETITITASNNTNYLVCYYKTKSTDVEEEIVKKIKIEEGDKATAWSPYGLGSVEIDICNKNFLKFIETDKTQSGLDVVAINNSIEVSGTSTASITLFNIFKDIKLKQGTYTFSFKAQNPPPANSTQFILCKEDGSRITTLNAWGNTNSNTITLEEDTVISSNKSYFYVNKNITFNNTKYELQIEKGESATEIIEPQSQNKIMPIQQEMLEGDYIEDVEHHEWGKVVFDGTENWLWHNDGFAFVNVNNIANTPTNIPLAKSNYFLGIEVGSNGTNYLDKNNVVFSWYSGSLICIKATEKFTNVEETKLFLQQQYSAGNPIIVYYKLATPLDLELTEEQKKVKDTPSYTYEGKTYIDNDSIAILEINYGSENIPLGNYIIPKPDSEEAKEKTNFVGYDYMIKFNNPYQDRVTYPISVGDYFEDLCDQVGLEAGNIDFVNSDYMILGNPFTNNEDCRTVLSNIAQLAGGFARIGRDNKVYIVSLSKDINETIDGNNYFTDFSKNNKWGEVNSLVLRISGTEGENTVIQDEESIEENGLTEIVIEDNYFLIDQTEREKVITPLWNSLKGLNYLPISTEYYGYPYLDSGDGINILDTTDTEYSTYIFNHTFKFNGGFDGQIDTPAMTKTQTAYKNTIDSKTRFRQVERKIDKVNGVIEDVIEEQTDFSNKLTQVEQTVDEISQKVEDIEDVTQTIEGTKTITLTNCVEGDLLELNIYGNNTVFDYLYPSNSLYPSDTLYPYGDSRLVVADENGNSITYELGVTEVLRRNGDICDEYVLKDGQAKVIRRINKNGTIKTTEEIEELGEFAIKLANGSNTITIKNYTGQLLAKYAIQNEYTNVFATKVEMQSSIEMNNEQINIELSKKTDNDKIIASINMSTEKEEDGSQLQLQADKISLNGVVTANSNFKINIDGSMEAKNGKFSGRIQNGEHPGSSIDGGTVITESGTIMCTDITVYASENNGGLLIIPNDFDEYFPNIQASYTNSQITFLNHENHEFPITIGLFTNTKTGHISLPNGLINVENGTIQTQNINATGYGYFESYVRASEFVQPSSEKIKENIYKLKSKSKNKKIINSAIDILKNADICEYNYKDKNKTSIGLVIGEEYNTPDEVLSEDKKGIDLYSMVSLSWKAIQELLEIINKQGQEIQKLKERTNTLEDIIKNNKNT